MNSSKTSRSLLGLGLTTAFASLLALFQSTANGADAPAGGMGGMGGLSSRGGAARPTYIEEGYNDHKYMQELLGITKLRPGKSGSNQSGPGFDEATANAWMPTMPDVMKFKNGTKVTSADQWTKRRAEIVADFESEVYGRIPADVPKVTWEVSEPTEGTTANIPTLSYTLTGKVDNSAFPDITVNISASFVVPKDAKGPLPIMVEFGGAMGGMGMGGTRRGGAATQPAGSGAATQTARMGGGMGAMGAGVAGVAGGGAGPWTQQALVNGWAYGYINPSSIQADSGGNSLRQGIIGLTNKGKPRKADDWGSLRAWGWGVSQLINFFEANPKYNVDAKKLGIEGVSRYGKAALVTQAFDPRVAVAFVASSGEGGAKLHRHDFGESVENLTDQSEYHWMCGNFLKYGAAEAKFGSMNASNLPVDSHELVALCAPRPCLISVGIEPGDPKWIDAAGCMRSGIGATPVYELLGKKGYGKQEGWTTAQLPPVGTLLGNDVAFRQHTGGHEATANYPTFFSWIKAYISSPNDTTPKN
jgi:hypothetical protein